MKLVRYVAGSALIGALCSCSVTKAPPSPSIQEPCSAVIPKPKQVVAQAGGFDLSAQRVVSGPAAAAFAEAAQTHLGLALKAGTNGSIVFQKVERAEMSPEGYVLSVSPKKVVAQAASDAGLFYAAQTLVQMAVETEEGHWTIPCATVTDEPRFEWRGLMLDEGRHFHGKEFVLHLLDNMALHKMNRFHWHLSDDEGWRVEVKGWPKLTEVGAWRGEGTVMPIVRWNSERGPRYGGFYTQADLKEVVAYAKARHIEIVPEIDMPGHVTALVTAYPELSTALDKKELARLRATNKALKGWEATGDINRAYRGNAMSVVNPKTYEFCGDLFDQLTAIFPFKYWHIGGDEVRTLFWEASPDHQALMKARGFSDPHQLQNLFLLRMEKMLKERGRTMVGWNEIMKGGQMSADTVVMGWLGAGPVIKAAKAGYATVAAPAGYTYFDMAYPGAGELRGQGWAGQIDTRRAYEWDPQFPDKLTPDEQKNILGPHACVWSEYVPGPANADYKFWPRALATAEVAWTPQSLRVWDEFHPRWGRHLRFLDNLNVNYRVAPPKPIRAKGSITLNEGIPGSTILYSTDGSTPNKEYRGEKIDAVLIKNLRCMTVRPKGLKSVVIQGAERASIASWSMASKSKKAVTIEADVTDVIDQAGPWGVFFNTDRRTANEMVVETVVLSKNGAPVVSLSPKLTVTAGREGSVPVRISDFDASARYSLSVTVKAVAKPRGKTGGTIAFDRN